MERKINTPICLSDRIYAYVEENKIRYQFLMVASTITEFIPIRYPINTVVLPLLTNVYIPQTLSRKDMLERKANNCFYERQKQAVQNLSLKKSMNLQSSQL